MTLEVLSKSRRVSGARQVTRAIERGDVSFVFIASDADVKVTAPVRELCLEKGIGFDETATMEMLGKACAITVGSAAAAVLK